MGGKTAPAETGVGEDTLCAVAPQLLSGPISRERNPVTVWTIASPQRRQRVVLQASGDVRVALQ